MLTCARIRYLIAIRELAPQDGGIRMTELSKALGITKPSVHKMLNELSELGLVHFAPRGRIHLSQDGRALASQCAQTHQRITLWLMHALAIEESLASAGALALMDCLPAASLTHIPKIA